jgi:hypothetical protein
VRRGRVWAPACPLRAAVAEQAADTCGVSFGTRGGLQPECFVQVADRLVLRPFPLRVKSVFGIWLAVTLVGSITG